MATKPKLERGESPQDESYQKKLREYHRQLALEEATAEQKRLQAQDAEKNAQRDVLSEVSTEPSKEEVKPEVKAEAKPSKKPENKGRALRDRGKNIDSALDAIETGIAEADEDNGVKK